MSPVAASHRGCRECPRQAPKGEEKSVFKVVKALAMLPVILACYTGLFFLTVNILMNFGGEVSDTAAGSTTLPWPVEFFGLIAILLLACKNLK